ncbi:MAG TPA: methyl-accepting chemotaxis protein, partial [Rhodocyclaceae bacterium]
MSTWREAYEWVEKTFWNSLTKKLMSFLLLFLIDLAYVGTYLQVRANVEAALARDGVAGAAAASVMAEFNAGLAVLLVLTAAALAWNLLQILYLRHLIVRPVRSITAIFEEIARGEGDFSRDLPLQT